MSALDEFLASADQIERDAARAFDLASDQAALTDVRNQFLGRTNSERANLKQLLGALPGQDKPAAGRRYNEAQQRLDALLESATARVAASRGAAPATFDRSMPGRTSWRGSVHPVSQVIDEIVEIFRELGFTIALGPELEH